MCLNDWEPEISDDVLSHKNDDIRFKRPQLNLLHFGIVHPSEMQQKLLFKRQVPSDFLC